MSLVLSMKRIKRPVSVVNRKSSGGGNFIREISLRDDRLVCFVYALFITTMEGGARGVYTQDLQIVSGEASQT